MRAGLLLTYFNNRSVLSANGFKPFFKGGLK